MNRIQNYCNKKVFIAVAAAALVLLLLMSLPLNVMAAGVDTDDRAEFNKTVAYLVTAVIAFVLLLGYCGIVKQKETLL